MFEQLKQLIQQYGQKAVVQNQDVPNEHNEAVMQEANKTIVSGLKQAAYSGNLEQMAQKAQSGSLTPDANHPAVKQMSDSFVNNLKDKFGISAEKAQSVANDLIPKVLNGLLNQVKSGELHLENLIQSLTGKKPDTGSDTGSRRAA